VGSDLVFLYCFWVNRGYVCCGIHVSPLKAVSEAISEWEATQISLTVYELTGAVWADESMGLLLKQFQWRFLSGQRLSFPWLFMSQQGLCGLTNPWVSSGKVLVMISGWATTQFSLTLSVSTGAVWADESIRHLWKKFPRLIFEWTVKKFSLTVFESIRVWALRNQCVTFESRFGGYFWVGSDLVFLDCLWVNRGCVGWRIYGLALEKFR